MEQSAPIAQARDHLSAAKRELDGVRLPDDLELVVKSHLAAASAGLARAEFLARYRPSASARDAEPAFR